MRPSTSASLSVPASGRSTGTAHREYEASYVAARELCLRLDDRPRLFPALWGLWHVSFNRGLYREARDRGEELLSLARQLGDPVSLLEAHHSLWTTLYGSGELEAAELHLQEGLAQYDPQRHRAYASVYGGHDTGVCCLNFAAVNAWTRGYPDRALRYQPGSAAARRPALRSPVDDSRAVLRGPRAPPACENTGQPSRRPRRR